MTKPLCPLCRDAKHMRKPKLLYNVPVCKKCFYKFANRRQLAYVVDWILFNIVVFFAIRLFVIFLVRLQIDPDLGNTILFVTSWIALPLIFFFKDGFAGHSLGKLVCGVQVVDRRTFQPVSFGRSFQRNLPLLIPFMPLINAILLQKGYRIGDGWAKSKVIWKKYANHPVFTGRLACENCQYDLTANTTGICPECGTGVPGLNQSDQSATFAMPLQTVG
jgi:hypothetical protein